MEGGLWAPPALPSKQLLLSLTLSQWPRRPSVLGSEVADGVGEGFLALGKLEREQECWRRDSCWRKKILCKDQFGEIEARAAFLATSSQNQMQVFVLRKQHCNLTT